MKQRLEYHGGDRDGRIVKGKLKSMQAALKDSYQAEWITYKRQKCRCLINPDKLKEDYDQKEISIEFDYGMQVGDVFYWDRTDSYWITYLREYSEEAYFRSSIRRCNYEIIVGCKKYRVYVRGPVETSIIWRQKHQIEFNDLNYTLKMYITKDENTLANLSRFTIIEFDGHNWQVEATDKYSQDGIIELQLGEYYDNSFEKEVIKAEPLLPDTKEVHVNGPAFVEAYSEENVFSVSENFETGTWVVNSSKVKIIDSTPTSCTIKVLTGKAGKFDLIYQTEGHDDIITSIDIQSL